MKTCSAYSHRGGCPMRSDCKLYQDLLQLAVDHVKIKPLIDAGSLTVLEPEYTTERGKVNCKNKI